MRLAAIAQIACRSLNKKYGARFSHPAEFVTITILIDIPVFVTRKK